MLGVEPRSARAKSRAQTHSARDRKFCTSVLLSCGSLSGIGAIRISSRLWLLAAVLWYQAVFRTLSEDLESSEKFANHPEDLESSGKFSASSGSFLLSLEVFEVRRSYLVGCWLNPCLAAVFAKH